jgi:hypothetical protein
MKTVGTKGRENRKVGFVLKEESKVSEGLTGRVPRRKIISEDTVEDESIPLRFVRVFDGRRKSFVIDEFDVRSRDENASTFRVLVFALLRRSDASGLSLSRVCTGGRTLERLRCDEAANVSPRCSDPTLRRRARSTDDMRMNE